jgi:hypothetical protein
MRVRGSSRVLTVLAVGFLLLDGLLLLLAGAWSHRIGLIILGIGFGVAAVGTAAYWRRHVRQLKQLRAELDARRREFDQLRQEIERQR